VIIRVDGHDIPILSEGDLSNLTAEERTLFRTVVHADIEGSSFNATLVADDSKSVTYDVRGKLPPNVLLDFTLVRPPTAGANLDIPSLRPLRAVGRVDHSADALHQVRLFNAVGAVTVAGGHVEMAMRKVFVSLRGGVNRDLAGEDIPAEWSRLHEALLKLCESSTNDIATKLKALLDEAEADSLRESRNDIIHGYWWLIPMQDDVATVARYYHPKSKQAPGNAYPTYEQLQEVSGRLFELASKLEALVTPEWPIAIVPALGEWSPPADVVELQSRADDQETKPSDLRVSNKTTPPKAGQTPTGTSRSSKSKRRKRR